ncbi:hypothetical protein [Streptomyces sp. NPDC002328]|uniref:hypothetical protein n=1 Tax=Streptomyces sp. NPDC002328 TaxID=3364642 RepID=UPI0036882F25
MCKVADKVFLIVTDDPDEQIITVKREPEHARALERGYASIGLGAIGSRAGLLGRDAPASRIGDLAHSSPAGPSSRTKPQVPGDHRSDSLPPAPSRYSLTIVS